MVSFDDLQEGTVYISYPLGKIYKKEGGLFYIMTQLDWVEMTDNELQELESLMFESWEQRFGSKPNSI